MAVISCVPQVGYVCFQLKRLRIGQVIRSGNHWYRVVNAVCGVFYRLEPYKPWAHR